MTSDPSVPMPAYQNFLLMSEKGGVRKSTISALLIAMADALGYPLAAFELEGRAELTALFPGKVTQVIMPTADALQEDDRAEIRTLSPVFKSMLEPSNSLAIVDVGANFDGRLAMAMLHAGMSERLANCGRTTVIIIPFFAEAASVQSAANSCRRVALSLPNAAILFCHCENGGGGTIGGVSQLPEWAEVIQPTIGRYGMMRMPRLSASVLAAYKASGRSHLRFLEMSEAELIPFSEDDMFVAGHNRSDMQAFAATMSDQFARHFDFRPT